MTQTGIANYELLSDKNLAITGVWHADGKINI